MTPFDSRARAAAGPILTSVALTLATLPLAAQEASNAAGVDAVFADLVSTTAPGCAVSVMEEGELSYAQGYGMANLEYDVPITPTSIFHVASVSKHFTAMAIELLVNEGQVDWDDDIREYVPEVPDFGPRITLRHLVHHTSGLRDQWRLLLMAGWRWEADVVTQSDVLDITRRQRALNFVPGERYLYSNTGFTLLAVVVERVTGQTLREFTTERIFEPLGMSDTHFHDDHNMIVPNRAWAYVPDPEGAFGLRNSIPDFDVVGATSLFTTVEDMAAWDRNFRTGEVGGMEAIERLREPFTLRNGETIRYVHGLSMGTHRGLRTEGHGGADAGYRSQFLRYPDEGVSVAVLCNSAMADPGGRARRVGEVYLGDRMDPVPAESEPVPVDAPTVALDADERAAMAGVYEGDDPSSLSRIDARGDGLRLQTNRGMRDLRPLGGGRFEVVGEGEVATIRTEGGETVLEWRGDRERRRSALWRPEAEELAEFEGRYHSSDLDAEYDVAAGRSFLRWSHRKIDEAMLVPVHRDAFRTGAYVIEFTRDGDGVVDGFLVSAGRVWRVRFDRADAGMP